MWENKPESQKLSCICSSAAFCSSEMKPKGTASALQNRKLLKERVLSPALPALWVYGIYLHVSGELSGLMFRSRFRYQCGIQSLSKMHVWACFLARPQGLQPTQLVLKAGLLRQKWSHAVLMTDDLWRLTPIWEISLLMFSYLSREKHVWFLTIGIINWTYAMPQVAFYGLYIVISLSPPTSTPME